MEADHVRHSTFTLNTALGPMVFAMTQDGPKIVIQPGMKYASRMKFGRSLPSRPFLRPAVEAMKDDRR